MWTCTCGEQNPDSAKMCQSCGSRMKNIGFQDAEHKNEGFEEKKHNPPAPWVCSCGETNPGTAKLCLSCGNRAKNIGSVKVEKAVINDLPEGALNDVSTSNMLMAWPCAACGEKNPLHGKFCRICGTPKGMIPVKPAPVTTPAPVRTPVQAPVQAPAPTPVAVQNSHIYLSTGSFIPGRNITHLLDVICCSDICDKESLSECFNKVKTDLAAKAKSIGAGAVIGINTSVTHINDSTLAVALTGTAVKVI